MEEAKRFEVPLGSIVRECVENRVEEAKIVKPPPPHFLNETKACVNRRAASRLRLEAARERVESRLRPEHEHKATRNHFTGGDFNIQRLKAEKQQATLLARFAQYPKHEEDTRKPLEVSVEGLRFSDYHPPNVYVQSFTITNTGPTTRRYNIVPPSAPFSCRTLAGELKPGLSRVIDIFFKPESREDARGKVMIRANGFTKELGIIAENEPANFRLVSVVLDDDEEAKLSTINVTQQRLDGKSQSIDLDLGPMICLYETNHSLVIGIAHSEVMPREDYYATHVQEIQSRYAEPDDSVFLSHDVHIRRIEVENKALECKMELFLNRESCVGCDFPGENIRDPSCQRARVAERVTRNENLRRLAASVGLADPSGVGVVSSRSGDMWGASRLNEEQDSGDDCLCIMHPGGVICLELEFGNDILSTDLHTVVIETEEESRIEITIHGYILNGVVEIAEIGSLTLPSRPRSVINMEQFSSLEYVLLPDKICVASIDGLVGQEHTLPVRVHLSGVAASNITAAVLQYNGELAQGIVQKNRFLETPRAVDLDEPGMSDFLTFSRANFETFDDLPTKNEGRVDCYAKIIELVLRLPMECRTRQRAILEIRYLLQSLIVPIMRVIFDLNPVYKDPGSLQLLTLALKERSLVERVLRNKTEKRTDYIFFSKPAIDFGIIPVSEIATFTFDIRNCSRTVYFPFIVSINLKSHSISIATSQTAEGVSFLLSLGTKNQEQGQGEEDGAQSRCFNKVIHYPDITAMLDGTKRAALVTKFRPIISPLPEDEEHPERAPAKSILSRSAKMGSLSSTSHGSGPSSDLLPDKPSSISPESTSSDIRGFDDVISIYPSCGILPPRSQMTITISLRPLALDPIDAFLVINTPSSQYYQGVIRKIQARLYEQNERMARSQSRLDEAALERIYEERCAITVPEMELLKYQQQLSQARMYSVSDEISRSPQRDDESMYMSGKLSHEHSMVPGRPKTAPGDVGKDLPNVDDMLISNERDVCCRVFGIVAAPAVKFLQESIRLESDTSQTLSVELQNIGLTEVTVNVHTIMGEAFIVNPAAKDELGSIPPNKLLLTGISSDLLKRSLDVTLKVGEVRTIEVVPGEQKAYIVARKHRSSFGALASTFPRSQFDLEDNVVLSAVVIEPCVATQKPYMYLVNDPTHHYAILDPDTAVGPSLYLDMRPYQPLIVEFVIANPTGSAFSAELTAGPDLIVPTLIKVPAKSKAQAAFAILSDRAGAMTTFVDFHDCRLKISFNAIGSDIILSSPYIRNFQYLIDHQGMADDVVHRVEPQTFQNARRKVDHAQSKKRSEWDELKSTLPSKIRVSSMNYEELSGEPPSTQDQQPPSSLGHTTNINTLSTPVIQVNGVDSHTQQKFLNHLDIMDHRLENTTKRHLLRTPRPPNVIDFSSIMTQEVRYSEIKRFLPVLPLKQKAANEEARVALRIHNPTVSAIEISISINDPPKSLVSLESNIDETGKVHLTPVGPFAAGIERRQPAESVHFRVSPQVFTLEPYATTLLTVSFLGSDVPGPCEALLSVRGLFILLSGESFVSSVEDSALLSL
ncbi:hypothetical protein GMRT_10245 [Giardia muris]|uniref:Uncharacterized protein n=1 Tax=Giardia muris TaxID=5742 RepID=A0A4Z1SU78_GIAMU|nr:hypothetical protein GMRT_10245 [Giardia muris]|eukprot:TNJ29462.1 hypothetical protein GMRT_10245 [Giardia muris]